MLASRGLLLSRTIQNFIKSSPATRNNVGSIRNGGHAVNYRTGPTKHPKIIMIGAEVVGACMWWWILWHLWHEHEHITGEFPYPDPRQWTNAELGIPADKNKKC